MARSLEQGAFLQFKSDKEIRGTEGIPRRNTVTNVFAVYYQTHMVVYFRIRT